MARITQFPNPDAPGTVLWQGHRPRMANAAVEMSQSVYLESTLSFREAEAARYRISLINGCLLCQDFRLAEDLAGLVARVNPGASADVGAERGEAPSPEFYAAIADWRESPLFSARERLAMEYAERIAESPRDLPHDDAFWSRLHDHFDEGEIVDLTYSINCWIATGRFVHVLGLDGSCPMQPPMAAA